MTTKTNKISIDFRMVRSGVPSDERMMALDWIQSNKDEAIDLIAKIKSFEFVAKNGGNPDEILWARIRVINFLSSLAEGMELQMSAEAGCDPLEYWRNRKQSIEPLDSLHSSNVVGESKLESEEFNETAIKPIKAPDYGDLSGF